MYKYTLFTVILFTQLFAQLGYGVGDQISIDRQNMEFEFCYPGNQVGNSFSFAQHNGNLNGGNYQVLMIEISATW